MKLAKIFSLSLTLLLMASVSQAGKKVEFDDPAKDDFGPGTYVYPTDHVYTKGSFDLRKVSIEDKGSKIEISIKVGSKIADPWNSKEWQGNGFSMQYVFLFVDTDHKAGSGRTDAPPGLNISFKPEEAWDKVILISPQGKSRLLAEIKGKAAAMKDNIVIPTRTFAQGMELVAIVNKADIGAGEISGWGFQAVMQSNEGYPAPTDLLTRKVNEFEGEHRFGGGHDGECDPHVLDILVAPCMGGGDAAEGQKKALAYECNADGSVKSKAVVPMIYQQ